MSLILERPSPFCITIKLKMMRQSEFKMKLDPELGRYTKQHIYGEGMMDVFKSFGSKLFGKTMKKAAKKGAQKAVTADATKTGEHVGKKAGDKIVQMLSKSNNKPKVTFNENVETIPSEKELNQRLNNLLSGGSTRKRKLYNY